MNFYKTIKLSILLVTGILVACAPDNKQLTNTQIKKPDNTANKNTQPYPHSAGMKVFIDPDTGKFLDRPPPGYVDPPIKSTQKTNNASNGSSNPNVVDKEQKSTTQGGGYYIKVPPPY